MTLTSRASACAPTTLSVGVDLSIAAVASPDDRRVMWLDLEVSGSTWAACHLHQPVAIGQKLLDKRQISGGGEAEELCRAGGSDCDRRGLWSLPRPSASERQL
jgi:hypothetical protein